MDSQWFKEDRKLPSQEQAEAKEESKKALLNSTFFQRRLERILNEMIAASGRDDEDFSKQNWQLEHVANISRRKVLREIIKLIQLK